MSIEPPGKSCLRFLTVEPTILARSQTGEAVLRIVTVNYAAVTAIAFQRTRMQGVAVVTE
jgi:hypothetical protein